MYGSPSQRPLINEAKRFDAMDFAKRFAAELAKKENRENTGIRTLHDATRVRYLFSTPIAYFNTPNTYFNTPYILYGDYDWPEIDFVPSNLGNGYIFYFICNRCELKVKYLYRPYEHSQPLCRRCHRLRYEQPKRKVRRLSRLIHKPYFSYDEKERIKKLVDEL